MRLAKLDPGTDAKTAVREILALAGAALPSIAVGMHEEVEMDTYRSFVQEIKELSDTLIVAILPLLSPLRLVEKAFLAGFHGLIFTAASAESSVAHLPAVTFAIRTFAAGAVFIRIDATCSEDELKGYVAQGLVPLCDEARERVDVLMAEQGLDRKWLYFLGFYHTNSNVGLRNRMMKKYVLELANLKYTLRVSKVEESYQSSSL